MRSQTRLMRVGVWLATTSLSLSAIAPAAAQPAPPPGAEQAATGQAGTGQAGVEQAGDQGTDPPALAGRLAALTGSVSFHGAGETQWNAATLNYPVTNGEAFWTEPQAQATLEVADDRLVMDSSTELDITALDQGQITATEAQGAIFLHLNSLQSNQVVTFNTPRGAVQLTAAGRYEIVAGDTNDATTVTVVEGAAHITGTNLTLDVGPQQTATIGGSDTLQGSVGAMQQDAFLQSMLRVPARPHFAAAVPRQVQYMTGAADLQTYGSFSQNAQYGQVWYPHDVARNWAPYRDGHWAYVHPWGWTWVDNARWGFAPFHYGRWVEVQNRWGWVAGGGGEVAVGESPYPVYSPALVSFVGIGGAALASVSIGFGGGGGGFGGGYGGYAPAWIPLGPREPYYPWYHCRPEYFGRVNSPYGVPQTIIQHGPTYINNVTNIRNVTNNRTNIFINQRAATVIPAAAFARGESVASLGRPLPERALLNAQPLVGRLAVRPTAETPNLPATAARRYNVALPAAPVRPVTAGPRIVPVSAQPRAVPELRRAALPGDVRAVPAAQVQNRPSGIAAPGAAPARPGLLPPARVATPGAPLMAHGPGALPGLRAPGAARPAPVAIGVGPQGARPGAVGPQGVARPGSVGPQGVARPGGVGPQGVARLGGVQPGLRTPVPPVTPPATGAGAVGRPGLAPRPGQAAMPQAIRPAALRPPEGTPAQPPIHQVQAPGVQPAHPVQPQATRPAPLQHVAGPRPVALPQQPRPPQVPHVQAPRPVPQDRPAPRPAPRMEAPRPQPQMQAPRPVPRMDTPRPAPRMDTPRPAPRMDTPRPAPRMDAPRPAPRMDAPRPAPRMEAPRPAPRMEAPRPQPQMQAPRPAPQPPRPAPAPRPQDGKHAPK